MPIEMTKAEPIQPASTHVPVAVSHEMQELREVQRELNKFLWSTELSYGHFLYEPEKAFGDLAQAASQSLAHITSEAWYPSMQGKVKLTDTLEMVLEQVRGNTVHVYRAVIIYYASAFEQYLNDRVGDTLKVRLLRQGTGFGGWGPYYETLSCRLLTGSKTPVRLGTVLQADLMRRVRNILVHPKQQLPTGTEDRDIEGWQYKIRRDLDDLFGRSAAHSTEVARALDVVVGGAQRGLHTAQKQGKTLPIELFYALFNFTNLDNLAFDIEEALVPERSTPPGRIWRDPLRIRRQDLIVPKPS